MDDLEQLLILACRYAHDRNTSAALLVTRIAKRNWHALSERTKHKLIIESYEARYNQDDWERLRELGTNNPPKREGAQNTEKS